MIDAGLLLGLLLGAVGALAFPLARQRALRLQKNSIIGALAEIETANERLQGLHADFDREKVAIHDLQRQLRAVEGRLAALPIPSRGGLTEGGKDVPAGRRRTRTSGADVDRRTRELLLAAVVGERIAHHDLEGRLRVFNAECDAVIAAVSLPGSAVMDERLQRATAAIDGLRNVMQISIARDYLAWRLAELRREQHAGQRTD